MMASSALGTGLQERLSGQHYTRMEANKDAEMCAPRRRSKLLTVAPFILGERLDACSARGCRSVPFQNTLRRLLQPRKRAVRAARVLQVQPNSNTSGATCYITADQELVLVVCLGM